MERQNIIIPGSSMKFEDWAKIQAFLRPDLEWPNPPPPVEEWWEWAENVYYSSTAGALNKAYNFPLPSKHMYHKKEDWRRWATEVSFQMLSKT